MTTSDSLALAVQHHQAGRLQPAEQIYRQILQLEPNQADAIHLLGVLAQQVGDYERAIEYIRRAVRLKPGVAQFHFHLAMAFHALRRLPEAIACYRQAVALKPDFADAHGNLGLALQGQGELAEAVNCARRAVELKPDCAEAHNNLGLAFTEQGKLEAAAASCRRALSLKPGLAEAHNNLGVALAKQGSSDQAIASLRRALDLNPEFPEAHRNLGDAFTEQGKLEEAVACYRRAVELKPDFAEAHSNIVFTRLFCPGCTAQTQGEDAAQWNRQHAAPLKKLIKPHLNDPSPDRRLRVGYVSPDFCDHVVGRNILPLFREHDHEQFEIHCYSYSPRPDELTGRFRSYADAWIVVAGLTDGQLAERIRDDRIDILIDLAVHTAGHRLLVFARQPAPVQVTFAGYPGTTGLSAIGYRLTDPHLDPPGLYDHCYSEESIRLPESFWCYDPLEREPVVNALPADENRCVTFGCLNNFCKVNPPLLKLWARVLQAVDHSRLILLADEGAHREETLQLLAAEGVVRDRITFVAWQPRPNYLKSYHGIDIGLDTVPYNGHTTSLDSAWMGVPVVTLVGETVVGRAGLSQLTNLRLPELIAFNREQYVEIAAELARDLPRLRLLRATLRDRLQSSPLMDAPRFARNIEAAYRQMWQRWCTTQTLP